MIKVKLNTEVRGLKAGSILSIDEKDQYWRRRLKEAKVDKSITILVADSVKTEGGQSNADAGESADAPKKPRSSTKTSKE